MEEKKINTDVSTVAPQKKSKTIFYVFALIAFVFVCCITCFAITIFAISNREDETKVTGVPPMPEDPLPVKTTPGNDELWETLLGRRTDGCEDSDWQVEQEGKELLDYPNINLPKRDEYAVIDSVRNFVASSGALDVLDSNGNIVVTFYDLGGYKINDDNTKIAFSGSYDRSCNIGVTGIYDLERMEFIPIDVTEFDEPLEAETQMRFGWSDFGNYVTVGQVPASATSYNEYFVAIFDASTGEFYDSVTLTGRSFLEPPCTNVCMGPWVNFDEENETLSLNLYDEFDDTSTIVWDLSGEYIKDHGFDLFESTMRNPECEGVEYVDGGTSMFCQY